MDGISAVVVVEWRGRDVPALGRAGTSRDSRPEKVGAFFRRRHDCLGRIDRKID